MSAALKEAEMCNGREGGGKQGEKRTRPESMNERKREVQAERIWGPFLESPENVSGLRSHFQLSEF